MNNALIVEVKATHTPNPVYARQLLTYLEILENNSGGVQPQAGTNCVMFSPGHARC